MTQDSDKLADVVAVLEKLDLNLARISAQLELLTLISLDDELASTYRTIAKRNSQTMRASVESHVRRIVDETSQSMTDSPAGNLKNNAK